MKKTLIYGFAMLSIVLSLTACKKEKKRFSLDEIVQTDSNGNILDRGNSSDWQLLRVNDDSHFDELVSYAKYGLESAGQSTEINYDCPILASDSISFLIYPNPAVSITDTKLSIKSKKPIICSLYGYRPTNNGIAVISYGPTPASSDSLNISTPIGHLSTVSQDRDAEFYCMIITADRCAYFSKGKVMFGNL